METPCDDISPQGRGKPRDASRRISKFRVGSFVILLVGATISGALIVNQNIYSVAEAVYRIGWGFVLVLVIQAISIIFHGFGWRFLFRSERPEFTSFLLVLRWLRESINYILPVGHVGGEMVAAHLLMARGEEKNRAVAGIVADKTLEVLGLFLFVLAGIVVLFETGGNNNSVAHWAIRALGATFGILITFLAAQRWGMLKLVDKVVTRFSGAYGSGNYGAISGIHDAVWAMYGDIPRLLPAIFLHTLAWVSGALQIWVAIHFMGYKIGWTGSFIIESLSQIVCAAAFIMPASLGAQEAAYMTIGWWLFGIPPAAGLAVSLVVRMKDVLFGVPGLVVWQGMEGKRLWTLWRERKK